jgi:hypothetical protein
MGDFWLDFGFFGLSLAAEKAESGVQCERSRLPSLASAVGTGAEDCSEPQTCRHVSLRGPGIYDSQPPCMWRSPFNGFSFRPSIPLETMQLAEPAVQLLGRQSTYRGGWPQGFISEPCSGDAPVKCQPFSSYNLNCCPSGQRCSDGWPVHCCPTGMSCQLCAAPSWDLVVATY